MNDTEAPSAMRILNDRMYMAKREAQQSNDLREPDFIVLGLAEQILLTMMINELITATMKGVYDSRHRPSEVFGIKVLYSLQNQQCQGVWLKP